LIHISPNREKEFEKDRFRSTCKDSHVWGCP